MPNDIRSHEAAETADELRTIGFRLREIQRLSSVRVEPENRRLAAEGAEPVSATDSEFFGAVEAGESE